MRIAYLGNSGGTSTHRAVYRARIYGAYVTGCLAPRLPYLRWLVRTCMPPDRDAAILDIGCGHGAILYALQQAGYHNARGVDGSAVQAAARLLLLASGFLRVEAYEGRPIPHGFISTLRAALWWLLRASLLFYIAVETGSLDRRAVFSQNLLAVAWKAG